MRFARVILDIPVSTLDRAYTYALPPEDEAGDFPIQVGCAVEVPFGNRRAIGFVTDIADAGGEFDGARIHSIRVPGVESIHEVFIGGPGQTLSIRHDATNFSCFWPGVALALRKVRSLHGLTVGLDQIMD